MSSSNSTLAEIAFINSVIVIFGEVWSYLLIILGTIGHSLNIYIFTRPTLYFNPCVRYFLVSTFSGFMVTYVNVLLRLLQHSYGIDAFGYSNASCKILLFVVFWPRALTSWFIALASIDRFLCSSRSVNVRAWSNLRVSSRAILFTTLVVGLAYIYVPIQFGLKQAATRCPTSQSNPPAFDGIWNLIIFSLGPPIVMFIFGSLTIRNLQASLGRIVPPSTGIQSQPGPPSLQDQSHRQKRIDRQLSRMMLIQCIYFTLLSCPVSINWLYTSLESNVTPNSLQSAKDNLFLNIAGLLSITSACTSFYLFTLSSKVFRQELMHLFNR